LSSRSLKTGANTLDKHISTLELSIYEQIKVAEIVGIILRVIEGVISKGSL